MKLSKRLKAICDMVPFASSVIDIGTDHGYVPIYLNKFKKCNCLATDISENSLNKAKKNALKSSANINFLLTNGLENINLKSEIIIISGMGTQNILKILDKNLTNDLIISTNNDVKTLKKELDKKFYYIHEEKIVEEHKIYNIIYFKKRPWMVVFIEKKLARLRYENLTLFQ